MSPAENIPSLLGLVPPWRIFLKSGLVLEKLLATVQAKAVPHVGAVKPEVPAGSCLFSSRNGWLGRGDCAIHSVMVVKGRRQGHRRSDELHPAVPVELFASRWAREQLTHCWECSPFPKILWLHIQAYCCAASNQDQLWLESEIFLSDWKIWTWRHQTYLVVKRRFQGSPGFCRRFTSKEETNGRIQARKKTAQMLPTAGTSPCSLSQQC